MCSRDFFIFFFILILLSFLFPFRKAFAASILMQHAPSHIGVNDEYSADVTLSISVADGTNYYLRGVFYKTGTTGNYCGYTWNGNDWFKGPYANTGDQKQFFKVTIANHEWSGQIKAKIDPNDSACATSGNYSFKIQRFTDTSNSGSFDDQTEGLLAVIIPTPTPTNTPIPTTPPISETATPTSKPTATPKPPTPTPKPAGQIPTSAATPTNSANTSTNSLTPLVTSEENSSFGAVLGTMSAISPTTQARPTFIAAQTDKRKTQLQIIPVIFILLGFGLLGSCGILIASQTEKGKALWKRLF